MSTETTTEAPAKPKRVKKTKRFIVQKLTPNGPVDCGYGLKKTIGTRLRFSRGVLIKQPEKPHVFTTESAADRAIRKTKEAYCELGGFAPDATTGEIKSVGPSMVADMPQLSPLFEDGCSFSLRLLA